MSENEPVAGLHEKRKMGVEITEESKNMLNGLLPMEAWNALQPWEKSAVWTHTLQLPDRDGQCIFALRGLRAVGLLDHNLIAA